MIHLQFTFVYLKQDYFAHNVKGFIKPLLIFLLLLVVNTTAQGEPAYYTVTAQELNVRSGPGTRFSTVTQLHKGETVVVQYMYDGDWAAIKVAFSTCYISRKYIAYKGPVPQKNTNTNKTAYKAQTNKKNISFSDVLYGIWRFIKTAFIILLVLIVIGFKDEIFQHLFYIGLFVGIGALITGIIFKNGSIGATIGFIVAVIVSLRNLIDIDAGDLGSTVVKLLEKIYFIISFPFFLLNQLQYVLSEPWRYMFKNETMTDSTKDVLRPILETVKIILYIIITPLRALNAIYYNIIIHGTTEMYDLLLEVLAPNNYKEGAKDFWTWLYMFPWRLLRYPIFHGMLMLLECVIWTVIDVFVPAITLYHGTDLTAGESIAGSSKRNKNLDWKSGTFTASKSSWGGIGVYFATNRDVAKRYAFDVYRLSDNNPVIIVCRVSLGRVLNYSLAPRYICNATGGYGHPPTLNNYAEKNHYTTGEWWNAHAGYWEYCMFDWQNLYNEPWRIRPIYLFNCRTNLIQHIKGGMIHWLFE